MKWSLKRTNWRPLHPFGTKGREPGLVRRATSLLTRQCSPFVLIDSTDDLVAVTKTPLDSRHGRPSVARGMIELTLEDVLQRGV